MRRFLTYVLCPVLLGFSISMPARNLPALPKDASVMRGELPNGISYYLVTNTVMKGVADFALVRKGAADTLAAREDLSALPHFNKTTPYKFMSRKGIGCQKFGYIIYGEEATMFRFDDVPVFEASAADTTLLMLFDIIAARPAPHAVIVSGDIKPAELIEKMKVFSLMVPSRNPTFTPKPYSWVPSEETRWSFTPSKVSSVEVDFRYPRTPKEQLNTIQPFLSQLFSLELGDILTDRLRECLLDRGIPVSSIGVRRSGNAESAGDEHFVVRLETTGERIIPATIALSSTLAELGSRGVGRDECKKSRDAVLASLSRTPTNSEMVHMCVSNYVLGSDLATDATKAKFFLSRNIPFDTEVGLTNSYIKALLGDLANATVRWTGDPADYDEWFSPMVFEATWNSVAMLDAPTFKWRVSAKDTTALGSDRGKSKLKSVSNVSGDAGEMWTFANGMRVIYKNMPTGGSFSYSMMIKGGYSTIRNLPRGEGAFFSDMMGLHRIAGFMPGDFEKVLRANGVGMTTKVSASDIRVCGTAPSGKYALVFKALLSVANDRMADHKSFEAYRDMELAMIEPDPLDSLLYPRSGFTDVKTVRGLAPSTLSDAESLFNNEFLHCSDGVIALAGELPAEDVQKYLAKTIGGFRVSKGAIPKLASSDRIGSGSLSYAVSGDSPGIKIGIASVRPYTTENHMAFRIACLSLGRHLSGVLAERGFNVEYTRGFKIFPQESVEVIFNLTPAPEAGLPAVIDGGASRNPGEVLILARKTIDGVLSGSINAAELASCKALVASEYAATLADPSNYADAVLMRYSGGKDVLTDYNSKINAVTADMVKDTFAALAAGRRIEYVIRPEE